jgi:hypothetical protein
MPYIIDKTPVTKRVKMNDQTFFWQWFMSAFPLVTMVDDDGNKFEGKFYYGTFYEIKAL